MVYNEVPLIASLNTKEEVNLLVGTSSLSQILSRIRSILKSGAKCVLIHPSGASHVKKLHEHFGGETGFQLIDRKFELSNLTSYGRQEVFNVVDRVFVSLGSGGDRFLMNEIYNQCRKLRIPINTRQHPELSTFSLLSTYVEPKGSGLQIAVTTNGQGCLLANRIRREVVAKLPHNIHDIVNNFGNLRDAIINYDHSQLIRTLQNDGSSKELYEELNEDIWECPELNESIQAFNMTEANQKLKRSRWLAQILEYYPLSKLANIRPDLLFNGYPNTPVLNSQQLTPPVSAKSQETYNKLPAINPGPGSSTVEDNQQTSETVGNATISLVGSGPGSVSTLTIGALHEIKHADLILADKLVPESVLELIPKSTETFIARKFPGNADKAQEELLQKGLEALQQGKKVVRLKQGDPYVYGRGGEEVLFFREHGFEPLVLPGISSPLAAAVAADIPITMRDIADQILICTGTGKKGVLPKIPEYVEKRTTIFMMALHRCELLVKALLSNGWDANIPVAIVERATCIDQRVTKTVLSKLPYVVEEIGSRPPGLLIIGTAVEALSGHDSIDNSERTYRVYEGLSRTDSLTGIVETLMG
ncbi:HBR243Cp [Eremothecium sinecaudum]|uniref:HBR243Cp n=1 Tax=Eremothecium sinecaudum TaxID=45286 RepID=A0A120K189_9SACH|nr:HBR243Cp [Eremothecium sinecaudum]AMD19144.1 HBR243Cp [Eremothecium sinecaudum]